MDTTGYGDAGLKDLEAALARAKLKPQPERNSTFLRNYAKISKEAPIGSMMSAAQTYDAVYLMLRAMFDSKGDLSSAGLKKALENPTGTYRGVVTTYERAFSPTDHDAISANMLWLGTWKNNERAYAFEDAVRDGVREAIAECMAAGMRVVMVTGNHPATPRRSPATSAWMGGPWPWHRTRMPAPWPPIGGPAAC